MHNGNGSDKNEKDNIVELQAFARQQEQWRKSYRDNKKADKKTKLKQDIKEYAALFNLNLPFMTKTLVYSFIAIHLLLNIGSWVFGFQLYETIIVLFSFIPGSWTGHFPFYWTTPITIVSHMFLHGSWFHLFVNSAMLMAFGTATEKVLGSKKMLLFFLLCGVCGAALHFIFYFSSTDPVIGASGGLSGLFAATFMLFQGSGQGKGLTKHKNLIGLVAVWIFISIIFAVLGGGNGSSIAWAAHIGGFLGGLAFYKKFLKQY